MGMLRGGVGLVWVCNGLNKSGMERKGRSMSGEDGDGK